MGLGVLVDDGVGDGVEVGIAEDVVVGVGLGMLVGDGVGIGDGVVSGAAVGVGDGVLGRAGVGTGDWVRANNAWAIPAVIVASTSSLVVEVSPQADSVRSTVSVRMIDRWNICCWPSPSTRSS